MRIENATPYSVYVYDWLGHIDDELTLAFETLREATFYAAEIEESRAGGQCVIVGTGN